MEKRDIEAFFTNYAYENKLDRTINFNEFCEEHIKDFLSAGNKSFDDIRHHLKRVFQAKYDPVGDLNGILESMSRKGLIKKNTMADNNHNYLYSLKKQHDGEYD